MTARELLRELQRMESFLLDKPVMIYDGDSQKMEEVNAVRVVPMPRLIGQPEVPRYIELGSKGDE